MTQSSFVAVDTTPEHYAAVTGLVLGAGFVVENGRPTGLYPFNMAKRIAESFDGITIHIVTARTYREGRHALRHLSPR